MNILSVFDGMSCGQIALNNLGVKYGNYFASEICPYAIEVTQNNYPQTKQLGDVSKINGFNLPKIDLFFGGSPCQGFSLAGKQLNFEDERSKLLFEFIRLKKETTPQYFLLENVVMAQKYQDVISDLLECEPLLLNSNLVSAQNRERLYWTNIPFSKPKKSNLVIGDILDLSANRKHFDMQKVKELAKTSNYYQFDITGKGHKSQDQRAYFLTSKMGTLAKCRTDEKTKIWLNGKIAYLTINELERLQTVPDDYTAFVANTRRAEMLGNGWTVKLIEQFFCNLGKQPMLNPRTMSLF